MSLHASPVVSTLHLHASMGMSCLWSLLLLVAAAAAAAGGGYRCPPGARAVVFNFGDSNSDTGGLAAGVGYSLAPPDGRAFFGRPTGRLCDGRLVIDFLCESLNTSYLSPYLEALGSDFTNGANFAVAGSTTLPRDAPFALHVQVLQFLHFKARSLDLISRGERGPVDVQGFQNALYTIDIGQNDVNALLSYLPYDQVLAKLPPVIAEIQDAVQTLYSNGARNFWIHGTGALGCLPQKLAMATARGGGGADDLDAVGCLRAYNSAAKAFNAALSGLCDQIGARLQDATVVYTDLFAIKYELVANHTVYGFDKPLMACCGYGGPPYNYDPNRSCRSPGGQLCDAGARFISWDGVHLTDAANAIVTAKILSGDYSRPQLKFDRFCKS